MNGGIPDRDIEALQAYWDVFPSLRKTLFADGARPGYAKALVQSRAVKATILGHAEFDAFKNSSLKRFHDWKAKHQGQLAAIKVGDKPKELIFDISEDLLAQFDGAPLLSKYDIYQILMTYWDEVMQDDVHMIVQDDWKIAKTVRLLVPIKDKNGKPKYTEDHDFEFGAAKAKKRYRSDIVPPALIIAKYFADKQAALNALQAKHDSAVQELETFIEENTGEDGLIENAKNDKGAIKQKGVKDRIKETNDADELTALKKCLALITSEDAAKRVVNDAKQKLDELVFKKIPTLSEDELKAIVVQDKWFRTVEARIIEEIERMTQQLAGRVKTLEERYAETLPALNKDVQRLADMVEDHLKKMGLAW